MPSAHTQALAGLVRTLRCRARPARTRVPRVLIMGKAAALGTWCFPHTAFPSLPRGWDHVTCVGLSLASLKSLCPTGQNWAARSDFGAEKLGHMLPETSADNEEGEIGMRLAVSPAGAWRWRAASCESAVSARASPDTNLSTSVGWTFSVYKYGQVAFQRSFLSSRPSEDEPASPLPPEQILVDMDYSSFIFLSRLLDESR